MMATMITVSASFTEDDRGFYVHFRVGDDRPLVYGPIPDAQTAHAFASELVDEVAAAIERQKAAFCSAMAEKSG